MKRNIHDLSINKYGSQIAIVENLGLQSDYESVEETAVRIYSVGRRKDEAEEEDEEMGVDSDDGSLSDNDSVGKQNYTFELFQKRIVLTIKINNLGNGHEGRRRLHFPFMDADSDSNAGSSTDDSDENLEEWLNNSSGDSDDDVEIFVMSPQNGGEYPLVQFLF